MTKVFCFLKHLCLLAFLFSDYVFLVRLIDSACSDLSSSSRSVTIFAAS